MRAVRSAFIRRAAQQASMLGVLLVLGCSHDLDALKTPSGGGPAGSGSSGSGGAGKGGSGASGTGSSGSGGGGDQDAGPGTTACEPCEVPDPVKNGAITIKAEACCYGARGGNCGVTFANADRCYPVTVEGADDPSCPDLEKGDLSFGGCCRPDAQCGVMVDSFNLGCVERSAVPKLLGGPLSSRSCVPKCTSEADCTGFSDKLTCVDDRTQLTARHCATFCQRDADCDALPGGLLCVLLPNLTENRMDQYCRKPLGTGKDGDSCNNPKDCQHGACVGVTVGYCTKLCGGDGDCSGDTVDCSDSSIATPKEDKMQPVRICRQH